MSRLLTNRRLFILLASVILLIVIAGLTVRGKRQVSSWPERLVMDVQNTVGAWIYRPVSDLTAFLGGIQNLHEMYVENAQLKTELQNYKTLQTELASIQAENQRLHQMLNFRQATSKQLPVEIPAHVIGRDPSQWNSEITIDVGRANGVTESMAVVATDGSLVGRVTLAADRSSKVELITDTQLGDEVSAMVQTGQAVEPFGVVLGSPTVSGELQMQFLSPLAQLKVGDRVVTSGLSQVFPSGILIGTISKLQAGQQGLTQSATIIPSADLNYLQDVFVVKKPGTQTP